MPPLTNPSPPVPLPLLPCTGGCSREPLNPDVPSTKSLATVQLHIFQGPGPPAAASPEETAAALGGSGPDRPPFFPDLEVSSGPAPPFRTAVPHNNCYRGMETGPQARYNQISARFGALNST
ncbi:hypothetical protein GQ607_015404 [Colletotrichum asianum]|uniref:Uncharacterized protein n=1 Tax=Colletotrichum asianum TaxID=702518 RepID=A0A8H3W316_9PEZI|nr:hypothetical protein GQ607_015404 [Colletotrichum asianum]